MAKTRNVIRYNSAGLFLADSVSDSRKEGNVAKTEVNFFNKLQSFQFSVETNRENIKQIGSDHYVARTMARHGSINVSFDYLLTDGYEENLLGLNILGPSVKYDEDGEAYNLNVQESGTIYNNLKENKSLFFVVGDEGHDLTAYDRRELGLEGTNVLGIGNGYISSYSFSASVGDLAKASVSFTASDFNFDCMDAGGGFYWERITEFFGDLLWQGSQDDGDFLLFEDGQQINLNKNVEYQKVGAIRNPSLDLINKGIPLDKVGFPALTFRPKLYKSATTAIRPEGINLKIKNLNIGGPTLNTESAGNSCFEGSAHIQSFDVNIPFEREDLEGFESMHMYGSKLKYPQLGTLSMSLLSSTFESGRFIDIFCGDTEYEIEIELNNECSFQCFPEYEKQKSMKFRIDNARLDGYSLNQGMGDYGTVDCNFSFEMSTKEGLFASGTYGNNKPAICHGGPDDDRQTIVDSYTISVQGENGVETGGGEHAINSVIEINATPDSFYQFDSWIVSGPGEIADPNSAKTTFTVGAGDATITANYNIVSPPVLFGDTVDSSISLSASIIEGALTYEFQGANSPDFSINSIILNVFSISNTFVDNITSIGNYYYRVRAMKGNIYTEWSNVEQFIKSEFTPEDITTNGWWDVSDNSTITEVSGIVTNISDKSDNNITLSAGSAGTNNHTLVTQDQNGLDVINFDGDDRYNGPGVSCPNGSCQFFVVCRVDEVDNGLDSIISCAAISSFQLQAGSSSEFNAILRGPDTDTPSSENFKGSYHIYNAYFNIENSEQISFVDGSIVGSSSYSTPLSDSISLRVFSNRGQSQYPKGRLGEIIILEDVSTSTRLKIEGYLAHKWGLQDELNPAHPYKDEPPSNNVVKL